MVLYRCYVNFVLFIHILIHRICCLISNDTLKRVPASLHFYKTCITQTNIPPITIDVQKGISFKKYLDCSNWSTEITVTTRIVDREIKKDRSASWLWYQFTRLKETCHDTHRNSIQDNTQLNWNHLHVLLFIQQIRSCIDYIVRQHMVIKIDGENLKRVHPYIYMGVLTICSLCPGVTTHTCPEHHGFIGPVQYCFQGSLHILYQNIMVLLDQYNTVSRGQGTYFTRTS